MSPRGLAIALFASLALNVFVVGLAIGGFVIAHRIHEFAPAAGRPRGPAHPLWQAADGLPPEHRDEYRKLLREQSMSVAQQVRQARMARRRAWAELKSEPFDAAAVSRDLDSARTLELQARGDVERRIVGFAGTLPHEERERLADGLSHLGPAARRGPPQQGPRPEEDAPPAP